MGLSPISSVMQEVTNTSPPCDTSNMEMGRVSTKSRQKGPAFMVENHCDKDEGEVLVFEESIKTHRKLRQLRFKKVQHGKPMCVLGRDVTMDLVLALTLRSLLGKMEFVNISITELLEWICE